MFTSIDLFCGAGGLTEGFSQAGFSCLFGNDHDPMAVETFRRNHGSAHSVAAPIEDLDASSIRRGLGLKPGDLDCLVGGCPCQGFSINAPERFLEDPRNHLFKDYVRFVDEFRPRTLVFENVPGMLSLGEGKVFQQICNSFLRLGYDVSYWVLYAPHYGVPQERYRLILLAGRDGAPGHPLPEFDVQGRANFTGGRKLIYRADNFRQYELKPKNTVFDALGDLPKLRSGEGKEEQRYTRKVHSQLARELRNGSTVLTHHVAPALAQVNLERLKHIKPGGSWRDIPHELLPAGMQRARRSDHTRRYGRLTRDGLSSTIMTKIDPHWGAAFHYDQDRTLTVREAARLQTFPDSYQFCGSRVDQYRQIGNAVPVLMARAIGQAVVTKLEGRAAPGRLFEAACR